MTIQYIFVTVVCLLAGFTGLRLRAIWRWLFGVKGGDHGKR